MLLRQQELMNLSKLLFTSKMNIIHVHFGRWKSYACTLYILSVYELRVNDCDHYYVIHVIINHGKKSCIIGLILFFF